MGHNLNTPGKDPLDIATYQISRLKVKKFLCFPYIQVSLCKTCDPKGGAIFGPMGHNLNTLDKGPLDIATYQISRL